MIAKNYLDHLDPMIMRCRKMSQRSYPFRAVEFIRNMIFPGEVRAEEATPMFEVGALASY